MAEYADTFTPPAWWLRKFEEQVGKLELTESQIAELAVAQAPGERWDRSRVNKMRSGERGWTVPFLVAASRALRIPPPIIVPLTEQEAEDVVAWMEARRDLGVVRIKADDRRAAVSQVLDAAAKARKDQTLRVDSVDEGSPRSPRTRRAPRGR